MIVAFTGHRSDKIGGWTLPNPTYIRICQRLEQVLQELKPDKAITGMALGVDQYAANVCVKLGIPFIAAVPFVGQEKVWPEKSKKIYYSLLKKAETVVVVSEGEYSAAKMQIRNEWMVNNCDVLIAVWDGSDGGTGNCYKYADSISKRIIRINPKDLLTVTQLESGIITAPITTKLL
jgi:uncharacterized phage-like protein YoqJ